MQSLVWYTEKLKKWCRPSSMICKLDMPFSYAFFTGCSGQACYFLYCQAQSLSAKDDYGYKENKIPLNLFILCGRACSLSRLDFYGTVSVFIIIWLSSVRIQQDQLDSSPKTIELTLGDLRIRLVVLHQPLKLETTFCIQTVTARFLLLVCISVHFALSGSAIACFWLFGSS